MTNINDKYAILEELGEGVSSKVYKIRSLEDSNKVFALKIFSDDYIKKVDNSKELLQNEIDV